MRSKAIIEFVKHAITALALLALAGCSSRNVDSLDAVKQGVIKDISKNINVAAMDVNVVSVSFRDKEADAVVSFAPKGGSAAQGLTMNYTMERKGDEWHIKSRAQSDLQKHAAQAPPNGAMPGADMSGVMPEGHGQAMPPGHPATGPGGAMGGGQQLPPDHPPLDSIKK
jgi:hypothetical protein